MTPNPTTPQVRGDVPSADTAAVFVQRVITVSANATSPEQLMVARIGIDDGDMLLIRVHNPDRVDPFLNVSMDANDTTAVDGLLSQLAWCAAQMATIRETRHALAPTLSPDGAR